MHKLWIPHVAIYNLCDKLFQSDSQSAQILIQFSIKSGRKSWGKLIDRIINVLRGLSPEMLERDASKYQIVKIVDALISCDYETRKSLSKYLNETSFWACNKTATFLQSLSFIFAINFYDQFNRFKLLNGPSLGKVANENFIKAKGFWKSGDPKFAQYVWDKLKELEWDEETPNSKYYFIWYLTNNKDLKTIRNIVGIALKEEDSCVKNDFFNDELTFEVLLSGTDFVDTEKIEEYWKAANMSDDLYPKYSKFLENLEKVIKSGSQSITEHVTPHYVTVINVLLFNCFANDEEFHPLRDKWSDFTKNYSLNGKEEIEKFNLYRDNQSADDDSLKENPL